MKSVALSIPLILFLQFTVQAQTYSRFIIVDQFGYLPDAKKIAVLKDPQTGFDASESFSPGLIYSVVNANTGEKVYTAARTIWGGGTTDASSGDKVWHFDFTPVIVPGTYYILDEEKKMSSYEFIISENVYNEVLKHAVRTFYYQRAGFKKEAIYAGEAWADEARWGIDHLLRLQQEDGSVLSIVGESPCKSPFSC